MHTPSLRGALALSAVAGAAGGVLAFLSGLHPAAALIAAGGGFAGTLRLLLRVIAFVNDQRGRAGRTRRGRSARGRNPSPPTG